MTNLFSLEALVCRDVTENYCTLTARELFDVEYYRDLEMAVPVAVCEIFSVRVVWP